MRPIDLVLRIVVLTTVLVAAPDATRAQSCVANSKAALVCGQGDEALTVHAETRSPSGTFAIGWRRTKDAPRSDLPDASHVEQHIVRLSDGKILGPALGRAWNDGEMRSNHIDLRAIWSLDESWLLVADIGRFSLVELAVYSVDAAKGTATEQGLLVPLKAAADPRLVARAGKKALEQYELELPDQAVVVLTNAGNVTLPLAFHIPRQDKRHDLVATFTVSQKSGRIVVSPIAIRFRRG